MPPRALPAGFVWLDTLPESKVDLIALTIFELFLTTHLHARTYDLLFGALLAQFARRFIGGDVEINVTFRHVSVTLVDQLRNEIYHALEILRSLRLEVRSESVERTHVFPELKDVFSGQLLGRDTIFARALDDFVIDVGDVAGERDFVSDVLEITDDEVGDDCRACMTDVSEVIDSRSARVHADLLPLAGDELFLCPR